jgi:nitrite reductase (NADH) small subunit
MTNVRVAATDEIAQGKGKELDVKGFKIALFNVGGKYYAIEALCRHQNGSLAPGRVDGEIIECPLHSWHYNITTGKLIDYVDGVRLLTYPVTIDGNQIYIDV